MDKLTIKDVAREAGVSIATVSRVLNGADNVDPDYASRVRSAVERLGWHPSSTAQSMRRGTGRTIGLILPNTIDPFFGSIMDSITLHAAELGENVIVVVSHKGGGYDEPAQFKRLAESSIDGLIFCSIALVDHAEFDKYFANLPVVICSRRALIEGRPHVYFDHQKGGYLAVKHLLEMGHRRIALFIGVFGSMFSSADELQPYLDNPALAGPYTGIDKYIGSRRAMDEMGVPFHPELVEFIDLGNAYESGYLAMQRLISRTTDFDSISCTNDLSATGAIHMLLKQHLDVPGEVSVIGSDDGLMATCAQPQLTTVVNDTKKLGRECVRTLNDLMNGKSADDVKIDVQLIVRQSSCRRGGGWR